VILLRIRTHLPGQFNYSAEASSHFHKSNQMSSIYSHAYDHQL
jgi:hypothetical protein